MTGSVKKRWLTVAIVMLAVATLTVSLAQAAPAVQTGVMATTTARLNMRSGPGIEHTRIHLLPLNMQVPVFGRNAQGDWLYVEYDDMRGWVAGWFTTLSGDFDSLPVLAASGAVLGDAPVAPDQPEPPSQPVQAPVASAGYPSVTMEANVRIRREPERYAPATGAAPTGQTFPVLARNGANFWVKIEHAGQQGWVSIWFTQINGDINLAPVEGPQRAPGGRSITAWEYHHLTFAQDPTVRMTEDWFEDQMRWLRDNGFHAVTSDELVAYIHNGMPLTNKSIILTFDIGTDNRSEYERIMQILQAYGMHGIFFIVTDAIWDECVDEIHCWPALQRWQQTGVASFGSHSVDHPNYRFMTYEEMLADLTTSKRIIESYLGPIHGFATPFEATPPDFAPVLAEAGYSYSFGGHSRAYDMGIHPYDNQWHDLPRLLPYSSYEWYPYLTSRAEYWETFAELVYQWTNP